MERNGDEHIWFIEVKAPLFSPGTKGMRSCWRSKVSACKGAYAVKTFGVIGKHECTGGGNRKRKSINEEDEEKGPRMLPCGTPETTGRELQPSLEYTCEVWNTIKCQDKA